MRARSHTHTKYACTLVQACTHIYTHSLSFSLSLSHTHFPSLSLSRTHTTPHTHTLVQAYDQHARGTAETVGHGTTCAALWSNECRDTGHYDRTSEKNVRNVSFTSNDKRDRVLGGPTLTSLDWCVYMVCACDREGERESVCMCVSYPVSSH